MPVNITLQENFPRLFRNFVYLRNDTHLSFHHKLVVYIQTSITQKNHAHARMLAHLSQVIS